MSTKTLSEFNIWERIARWLVGAAFFLTPLFFLPLTHLPVSLDKQVLLGSLVLLALISWLIGGVAKGRLVYRKNTMNLVVLSLVAFSIISAIFSGASNVGFFGANGGEVDVFVNVLVFGAFFFLLTTLFRREGDGRYLLSLLFVSSLIILVYSLFQFFGVWLLPWDFTHSVVFNSIGTTNSLSIYLGAIFVILLTLLYLDKDQFSKKAGVVLSFFAATLFITTFLIGYWAVFAGFILVGIILSILRLRKKIKNDKHILLIIIAISAVLVLSKLNLFNLPLPTFNLLPEAMPSLEASWDIGQQVMREDTKNAILGVGPSTYPYQYALYRDPILNTTPFWGTRFTQGANVFLTFMVNWGALGMILFAAFLLMLILQGFKMMKGLDKKQEAIFWAVLIAFLYLVLSAFLYHQNYSIFFLIFVLAALLSIITARNKDYETFSLVEAPQKTLLLSLGLMIAVVFVASVLYLLGQHYVAAAYFKTGRDQVEKLGVDKGLPLIQIASDLDSRNEVYLRTISTAYLIKINNLLKQKLSPAELQKRFSTDISSAIASAKRATEVNRLNGDNWINLGSVYENIIPLVPGSEIHALEAYNKAAKLEPSNPVIHFNIGRANHLFARRLRSEGKGRGVVNKNYGKAINSLEKAIKLKNDYAPAHFLLVQIYDQQGKIKTAINKAERIKQIASDNVGVLFQLALLHYESGRFTSARKDFEAVIKLSPSYSNARYFLGLIYDRQKDPQKALEQFEAIQKTNPNNEEIKKIILNLKTGKKALSGIVEDPLEIPVEQNGDGEVISP